MDDDRAHDDRPVGQHVAVMLGEVVDWLVRTSPVAARGPARFIDCTLGGGGHAAALLEAAGPSSRLLGFDADPAAVAVAAAGLDRYGERVVLVQGNFRHLAERAVEHGFGEVHGIVMDLGLSSRQLEASGRGFSFRHDEPLDMRFDPERGETAADLLNRAGEQELADLIYRYGEERASRRIARQIVRRRDHGPLSRTGDLVRAVEAAVGPRRGRIHPATRTFQALRITVNDELGTLEAALPQAASLLAPGGRLAVISFHSLEDRLVKWFFRGGGVPDAPLSALTRRPISPSEVEVRSNPRARSAKLRIAERTASGAAGVAS